jgi:hypothetical protein
MMVAWTMGGIRYGTVYLGFRFMARLGSRILLMREGCRTTIEADAQSGNALTVRLCICYRMSVSLILLGFLGCRRANHGNFPD